MKLKPKKIEVKAKEAPKPKIRLNNLSDEYKPMFKPTRILVRDVPSMKDPNVRVKQYLDISVKRYNDDDARPFLWISMYQESDFYTGYLKGKTIYLPINTLYDLTTVLNEVGEECDKMKLFEEFDP